MGLYTNVWQCTQWGLMWVPPHHQVILSIQNRIIWLHSSNWLVCWKVSNLYGWVLLNVGNIVLWLLDRRWICDVFLRVYLTLQVRRDRRQDAQIRGKCHDYFLHVWLLRGVRYWDGIEAWGTWLRGRYVVHRWRCWRHRNFSWGLWHFLCVYLWLSRRVRMLHCLFFWWYRTWRGRVFRFTRS
jgi:hypothetical protein